MLFRSITLELMADRNLDGAVEDNEVVAQSILLSPPYTGSMPIQAIVDYVTENGETPEQLAMRLKVKATDGVGNATVLERPLQLLRNAPPEVTGIRVLDQRGFSLGLIDEITEGREVVLDVVARDLEAGVDTASLFVALASRMRMKVLWRLLPWVKTRLYHSAFIIKYLRVSQENVFTLKLRLKMLMVMSGRFQRRF